MISYTQSLSLKNLESFGCTEQFIGILSNEYKTSVNKNHFLKI
jgi:hypothetical protein